MAKPLTFRKIFLLMSSAGMLGLSQYAAAAAFQLYEQDGANIGNYHAGYAATADDASTSFYNPAGLVRIQNQEFVFGADPVLTDFKFRGTINVNTLQNGPQPVTSQGGNFGLVPFVHYAAPIMDNLVFGFSIVAPYGLKTDWSYAQITRYAATLTSLNVIDFAPSFGFGINDKFSVGAGLDIERSNAEFDLVGTAFDTSNDSKSVNKGSGHAYGYHLGALYQFTPSTRLGLSYHSKVVHQLHGTSTFTGNLANEANGGMQSTPFLRTELPLPATTSLSLFHTFNPSWDGMGTITYTEWNVFNQIVLTNSAGVISLPDGSLSMNNNIIVTVPEFYRNAWNYSVGSNYHINESWMLRSGLGYDQTPSNNTYRNLQLPDSDRIALAVGGHYQANKAIGLDFGWTHFFVMNTNINNLSQAVGTQITTTDGSVRSSADVFGFQIKWDIA